MQQRIFAKSWAAYQNEAATQAAREVENLPREQFSRPNLAGVLDAIADSYKINVATLQPDKKQGKRREFDEPVEDYGRQIVQRVNYIEVSIPFAGDARSFDYAPSPCRIIGGDWEIRGQHILVTLPDDHNLQAHLDQFIEGVTANLDQLRKDVEASKGYTR